MQFTCTISRRVPDEWVVRHVGAGLGSIEVRAATRDQALEKMRRELRYRLEFCPCTGETYRDVPIELVETPA